MKPYFYNDSTTFELQAGHGGVNVIMAKQYKRVLGQSLENILVELWATQPDMRDPESLNDLWGLEVSLLRSRRQSLHLLHLLHPHHPHHLRLLKDQITSVP